MGTNAPQMQRICMMGTHACHLAVTAITMNSLAINASPNMAGKEIKAVKRNIFRNIFFCRMASEEVSTRTG